MHVIEFFDRGAANWPDRVFLLCDHVGRTYAETQAASHAIASSMLASGFRPGMRAAILSENCIEAIECLLGIFRAGGVWVSLNARNSEEEVARILNLSRVTLLLCMPSIRPPSPV